MDPAILCEKRIGKYSDMWSLGSLLIQMLVKSSALGWLKKDYIKANYAQLQKRVSSTVGKYVKDPVLKHMIERCMVVESSGRGTARELLAELHGMCKIRDLFDQSRARVPVHVLRVVQCENFVAVLMGQSWLVEINKKFIDDKMCPEIQRERIALDINQKTHTIQAAELTQDQFEVYILPVIKAITRVLDVHGQFAYQQRPVKQILLCEQDSDNMRVDLQINDIVAKYYFRCDN
jgi:serine/threonine protein kinase